MQGWLWTSGRLLFGFLYTVLYVFMVLTYISILLFVRMINLAFCL